MLSIRKSRIKFTQGSNRLVYHRDDPGLGSWISNFSTKLGSEVTRENPIFGSGVVSLNRKRSRSLKSDLVGAGANLLTPNFCINFPIYDFLV